MKFPNQETYAEAIGRRIKKHEAYLQRKTSKTGQTYLDHIIAAKIDLSGNKLIHDIHFLSPSESQTDRDEVEITIHALPLMNFTINIGQDNYQFRTG